MISTGKIMSHRAAEAFKGACMTADEVSFRVEGNLSELDRLATIVHRFGEEHRLPDKVVFALNLALDELITNTIKYGRKEDGKYNIMVGLACASGAVTLTVEDDGAPFDPLQAEEPDITCPIEEREIGGMGLHLLRRLMDEIKYERRDGKNLIRMKKIFEPAS